MTRKKPSGRFPSLAVTPVPKSKNRITAFPKERHENSQPADAPKSNRTTLSLGPSFEIDANIAVRRAVLLGQPDSGKTNGLTVIAEGLLKIRVPPVILDWKGDLWGLRSSAAGDREGYAIAILGGDHGDIELDEHDGRELGTIVADEHLPVIVDLSGFPTDAARRRFAAAFLRAFFASKRRNVTPHPLLIDEYQKFAPEKPYEGERDLLAITEQVVGLGRKRGIGLIGTALRAAGLNKNIVELSDVYFFMQIAGKNDLNAIDDTIRRVASEEERVALLGDMPKLGQGEVFVYSPGWLRLLERRRFRLRETFDSSKTPEVGSHVLLEPRILAIPDIPALRERVEATREKREAEDPEVLRRRIVDLEAQIKRRGVDDDAPLVSRLRAQIAELVARPPLEVNVLTDRDRELLSQTTALLGPRAEEIGRAARSLATILSDVQPILQRVDRAIGDRATSAPRRVDRSTVKSAGDVAAAKASVPTVATGAEQQPAIETLPLAARGLIIALGSLQEGQTTRKALAALAGYSSRKSTIRNALSTLRTRGLIETSEDMIVLTPAGRDLAGPPAPARTTKETVSMWREKLRHAGPQALLDALVSAYPDSLTREDLGVRAGIDPTKSTLRNALSRLRVQGLVEEEDGRVRASATLFPTGPLLADTGG